MTGTVKQDAEGMAKAVFALSYNAGQGKDFLDGTDYKYDDTQVAVRIPYQAFNGQQAIIEGYLLQASSSGACLALSILGGT